MADKLTLRGMVDAIISLDLVSVKKVYNAPPESNNTADLPALWPMLPSIATNDREIACVNTQNEITVSMMIAVQPYGQDVQSGRFDLAIKLGDELRDALDAWNYSLWVDYDISVSSDIVGSATGYWGIVANITARNS